MAGQLCSRQPGALLSPASCVLPDRREPRSPAALHLRYRQSLPRCFWNERFQAWGPSFLIHKFRSIVLNRSIHQDHCCAETGCFLRELPTILRCSVFPLKGWSCLDFTRTQKYSLNPDSKRSSVISCPLCFPFLGSGRVEGSIFSFPVFIRGNLIKSQILLTQGPGWLCHLLRFILSQKAHRL